MAQREILLPWLQQPQEAVELNPGFPAIAGFVSSASGAQILAAGAAEPYAEPTGPNLLFRAGPGGIGAGTAGSVTDTLRLHSVANQTDTVWEQPKAQVSVALFLRRNGNTGGNSPMFGNLDPNTSPYTAWGLIDGSGTGALRFECSAGGAYRSVAGGTLTNNEDYVIVATYDGSTARLYLRGVEVATGSFSGNITYPNQVTRGPAAGNFFNYTGAGRAFNGLIYGGILHDGAWSPDLVRSISSPSGFWQFVRPQSLWVPVSAGGGPTPVGLSAETDASLSLPAVQIKALGRADETDTAIALPAVQVAAAGLATETDTAFALGAVQSQSVGLATENDAALALAAGSANGVGLADETDSALALAGVQIAATGIALETDTALALTGLTGTAPGIATEADTAFALAAVQKMAAGLAAETDEALAPGAAAADVGISLGGRRRKRDWRSFDVMPHWTPPDADGDMSDGEPVPPEEDAEPVKVRSALSMGLDGSGDAPAPVEPASAVVEVVLEPEPEAKPLTLADVITRDDLTHDELVQAIKLLARAQSGGLVRSTPRLTLRRVS